MRPRESLVLPVMELRPIGELSDMPGAAKVHTPQQIAALAGAMAAFGFDQPLVCDGKGRIVKGRARRDAALLLGQEALPVLVLRGNRSEAELRAARLADNRTARSHWNPGALALELEFLTTSGRGDLLTATGFSREEIQGLLQSAPPPRGAFSCWDAEGKRMPRSISCPVCGERLAA